MFEIENCEISKKSSKYIVNYDLLLATRARNFRDVNARLKQSFLSISNLKECMEEKTFSNCVSYDTACIEVSN